mmetsp:Transcript_3703/g.23213  ORF Transcript_3703/g.23213 Transcript_3703/m.23213 type:complete len:93 (-) Transcript_3703:114-392(-)
MAIAMARRMAWPHQLDCEPLWGTNHNTWTRIVYGGTSHPTVHHHARERRNTVERRKGLRADDVEGIRLAEKGVVWNEWRNVQRRPANVKSLE